MPKLLIVTYHFPPSASVGGIRPAKFAKYLPEFGWEPLTLTVPVNASSPTDPGRLRDVGACTTHHVARWPTPLDLYQALKRYTRNRHSASRHPSTTHGPSDDTSRRNAPAYLRRTAARYFSTLFETPDKEVGWLPPAVARGLHVIRKEQVDVLLATSPPATAAFVGLVLSVLSGRPLVTDLRDPFNLHADKPPSQRTLVSDALERWIERTILRRSARIVTTTAALGDHLTTQFPELAGGAIHTIPNGYDPDDFSSLSGEIPDASKFVVSYLGTFYLGRTPRDLLCALGDLVREGAVDSRDLRVVFCGHVEAAEGEPVRDLVHQAGLANCVTLRGHVSYGDAIRQMRRSSVLVLLAPNQPLQIPGKAFEYLGAGRPILCVSSPGATADLVRQSGAGYVIEPNDVHAMKDALRDLYNRWRFQPALEISTNMAMYDRRTLTGQLSAVLASVLSRAR